MMNTRRSPFLVVENESFAINCFAALKNLDSAQQLDHYLYNQIVSNALYDPDIHTFEYACQKGNLPVLKYLIEEEGTFKRDHHYDPRMLCPRMLWLAVENGHLEVVKYLIEDLKYIYELGDYALEWAARAGHLPIVEYLVGKGVDIHTSNDYPLRWSSYNGHLDVVKFLVEQGADIHAEDDHALHVAAEYGHSKVVEYLSCQGQK